VGVDPGALDPKSPRQLGGIDQLAPAQPSLLAEVAREAGFDPAEFGL